MSNFTFIYPYWFLALAVLPAIWWLSKTQSKQGLLASHIARYLAPESSKPSKNRSTYFGIWWLVGVIALAGPSFEKNEQPSFEKTQARVVIMDMSMSLYATDIKPNRLTQARYKALDLLSLWKEGLTGMIAYAGDAYTISPLTSDINTIKSQVPNLSPDIMPYQGGNAASAVKLAIDMMTRAHIYQGDLVLIADDIDAQEKEAIDSLLSGNDWTLSILAVGTESGAPISLPSGSMLLTGSGQTVVARTHLENMSDLTRSYGGTFTEVQFDNSDVEHIANYLDRVATTSEVTKTNNSLNTRVNNGFWLLPLLLLSALGLFRKGVIWCALAVVISFSQPNTAFANPWKTDDQIGYQLYQDEDFQQAAEQFTQQEWKGIAQYKAGDFEAAEQTLQSLNGEDARYNLANAQAQQGKYDQAIEEYQHILENNPEHAYAKKNLEIVKQAQKQQQQQGDSDSKDQKDQNQQGQQNDSSQSSQDQQQSPADNGKSQDQSSNQEQRDSQDQNSSQGQPENHSDSEKSKQDDKQAAQQSKSDQPKQSDQESAKPQSASAQQASKKDGEQSGQQAIAQTSDQPLSSDPDMRKLEQVESARDPSQLLKAQMILQARQKSAPNNQNKKW
ncbi:VWA domain-containing protein [Vibrio kanaloae]|uniref:VWA domain-containing protein n=1 Tax=Vibrio kanaloae TaxID=170673 RepID=UPI0012457833|nr:VWA domain-containing protein [Vibrio kanaloae]KAB0465654.1 VWA domain-containing protein [Vibrio kanaloae]